MRLFDVVHPNIKFEGKSRELWHGAEHPRILKAIFKKHGIIWHEPERYSPSTQGNIDKDGHISLGKKEVKVIDGYLAGYRYDESIHGPIDGKGFVNIWGNQVKVLKGKFLAAEKYDPAIHGMKNGDGNVVVKRKGKVMENYIVGEKYVPSLHGDVAEDDDGGDIVQLVGDGPYDPAVHGTDVSGLDYSERRVALLPWKEYDVAIHGAVKTGAITVGGEKKRIEYVEMNGEKKRLEWRTVIKNGARHTGLYIMDRYVLDGRIPDVHVLTEHLRVVGGKGLPPHPKEWIGSVINDITDTSNIVELINRVKVGDREISSSPFGEGRYSIPDNIPGEDDPPNWYDPNARSDIIPYVEYGDGKKGTAMWPGDVGKQVSSAVTSHTLLAKVRHKGVRGLGALEVESNPSLVKKVKRLFKIP